LKTNKSTKKIEARFRGFDKEEQRDPFLEAKSKAKVVRAPKTPVKAKPCGF